MQRTIFNIFGCFISSHKKLPPDPLVPAWLDQTCLLSSSPNDFLHRERCRWNSLRLESGKMFSFNIWVCLKMLCTPINPMVLLIIIPFLNGYFIGNIPYFQTNPYITGSRCRISIVDIRIQAASFSYRQRNARSVWGIGPTLMVTATQRRTIPCWPRIFADHCRDWRIF